MAVTPKPPRHTWRWHDEDPEALVVLVLIVVILIAVPWRGCGLSAVHGDGQTVAQASMPTITEGIDEVERVLGSPALAPAEAAPIAPPSEAAEPAPAPAPVPAAPSEMPGHEGHNH